MYFRNIIHMYFKKNKLLLGRWNYPLNKKVLDRKIYLANYDNCGPCGKIMINNKDLTVGK
mgnify:CR=1 FL=1|jgi:hypothetical protein